MYTKTCLHLDLDIFPFGDHLTFSPLMKLVGKEGMFSTTPGNKHNVHYIIPLPVPLLSRKYKTRCLRKPTKILHLYDKNGQME